MRRRGSLGKTKGSDDENLRIGFIVIMVTVGILCIITLIRLECG